MPERVELVLDPLRGERVAVDLPLEWRRPVADSARALGLAEWVDLSDAIVAKGIGLVDAGARAVPPIQLAVLGGAAHRMRCPSSDADTSGLRRSLHDLDLACLHREIRAVRAFLESVHEREGSALRFFATSGDRIFNSLGEGRRFRYHMVTEQRGSQVVLGTVDLLADEFRFCHRIDLREDVASARAQHGTLSLASLLLAKLQFIQRVPEEASGSVRDRVLEPFGRHDVVIGPEAKDVQDIFAILADHPFAEGPDGVSPSRIGAVIGADAGFGHTATLNLGMLERSPILAGAPGPLAATLRSRLAELRALIERVAPKWRPRLLGGPWWEEVDAQPAVDSTVNVG